MFLLTGGIAGGTNVWAWTSTEGLPREHSIVLSREDTGETERCSRRSWSRSEPVYEVTYKSFAPPEGRAELFTNFEGCGARNVGDTEMIVRAFNDDGNYRVWFIHPDTLFDALWPGVLVGIGAGVFGAGLAYLAKRFSETRRGKHGAGPGKH